MESESQPEERSSAPAVVETSPEPAAPLPVESSVSASAAEVLGPPAPVIDAAPSSTDSTPPSEAVVAPTETVAAPLASTDVPPSATPPTATLDVATLSDPNANRWSFASRAFKAAKKLLTTELVLHPQTLAPSTPIVADAAPETNASESESTPTNPIDDASTDAPEEREPTADELQAATPALCGHSSVLAVPEVLGLLANLHKSGHFSVWNDVDAYRIHLVDGNVVSAQVLTSHHTLMLGRILVDHGALTEVALTQFLEAHPLERRRLGAALVEAGLVDENAIASAVAYQAQRVFHAAYDLRDAWYRFDVDRSEKRHERGLSVTHLLLESARMRDETEQRLSDVFNDPFAA
ncbi:MAG: DUF4388 domain-containing protein [Planctomycetes bacterium]|nr:DUF4388 domain-containing protein [Planctomycetota bacterium]